MVEENKKKETDGVKELRSMTTELNKQKENEKFQEIKKKKKRRMARQCRKTQIMKWDKVRVVSPNQFEDLGDKEWRIRNQRLMN